MKIQAIKQADALQKQSTLNDDDDEDKQYMNM